MPLNAILSTNPIIIVLDRVLQNGVIDGVTMYTGVKRESFDFYTCTEYFAVVLARELAWAIEIPVFIFMRRIMSVDSFIFRLNLPSSDASIRQKASLLRIKRTLISTQLMSILSWLKTLQCRWPITSKVFPLSVKCWRLKAPSLAMSPRSYGWASKRPGESSYLESRQHRTVGGNEHLWTK